MDDTCCHDFFAHPSSTLHRRFEALRAVFLDHRPLAEIARQFGYRHGTLRNLVSQFRAQCRAGRAPFFSSARLADAPKGNNLYIP
jgi:transposase-like protein